MASTSRQTKKVTARSVFWWFLSGLFAILAVLLLRRVVLGVEPGKDSVYDYEIKQELVEAVHYFESSYFNKSDLTRRPAYITNLTDTIDINYKYTYQADQSTDLKYTYSARAILQAGYSLEGDKSPSQVWKEEFEVAPVIEKKLRGDSIHINEVITIPYGEYKHKMDNFKADFALPTDGEVIVVVDVKVSGNISGATINDSRQAIARIPLNQQIYKITSDVEPRVSKLVYVGDQSAEFRAKQYYILATIVSVVLSVVFLIIGFSDWLSEHFAKTPYQRELAKIYKYHDSIIVQTSKPMSLTGKSVVEVETFDDILDIEDSSKSPIIAKEIGSKATRFMIIQEDIVYTYVLGDLPAARQRRSR